MELVPSPLADKMEALQQQMAALLQQQQQMQEMMAAQQQQIAQQQQFIQQMQPQPQQQAVPQELLSSLSQLTDAMKGSAQTRSLGHTRGFGRPASFSNNEEDFRVWRSKTANYICGVRREAKALLESASEKEEVVTAQQLKAAFFEIDEHLIDAINRQLFQCLMHVTEGESFDLVQGAGDGEGLEAWRRLQRRWDPSTAGRARGLLREILNPGRAKFADLQGAIERLEDMMRRYCSRKDSQGNSASLPEDIRMAALESR